MAREEDHARLVAQIYAEAAVSPPLAALVQRQLDACAPRSPRSCPAASRPKRPGSPKRSWPCATVTPSSSPCAATSTGPLHRSPLAIIGSSNNASADQSLPTGPAARDS